MRYEAKISAYDALDQVLVGASVYDTHQWPDGGTGLCLSVSSAVPGEGVDDAREWLRDALVALLECL